jgi:hypothetical protein
VKKGTNSILMKKTKEIRFRLHGFFCFITLLITLAGTRAYSQAPFTETDTADIAEQAVTKEYEITESNVEFPEILKGNEEAASDYIEKFSERRRDYLVRMYTKGKNLLPKAFLKNTIFRKS